MNPLQLERAKLNRFRLLMCVPQQGKQKKRTNRPLMFDLSKKKAQVNAKRKNASPSFFLVPGQLRPDFVGVPVNRHGTNKNNYPYKDVGRHIQYSFSRNTQFVKKIYEKGHRFKIILIKVQFLIGTNPILDNVLDCSLK